MLKSSSPYALLQDFTIEQLLHILEVEAKKRHDGHFTIFAFTTCYKVALGIPDPDAARGREQIAAIKGHVDLKAALIQAIATSATWAQ